MQASPQSWAFRLLPLLLASLLLAVTGSIATAEGEDSGPSSGIVPADNISTGLGGRADGWVLQLTSAVVHLTVNLSRGLSHRYFTLMTTACLSKRWLLNYCI